MIRPQMLGELFLLGQHQAREKGETLLNVATNATSGEANVAITFGHLVKVEAGEFVEGKEISSNSSSLGFIGFELPRSLEIL